MLWTILSIVVSVAALGVAMYFYRWVKALPSAGSEIERIGNTSRAMKFEARKVVVARPDLSASAADFLEEPIVVCRAHGTCVTPKDSQRISHK